MLFGTIFGDIVGSQYEGNCVKNNDFDLITDRIRFTDDTVMTLAVASWLIKDKNNPTVLIKELQYYGNRYPHAGYGGSFARWLRSEVPQPYYSYGNGSAMRVSPCAWVAKSLEECIHRDSLRENPIGEEVIRNTYNKYKNLINNA